MNAYKVIAVFWLLLTGVAFGKFMQPSENAYRDFFSGVRVLQGENDLKTSINTRENWLVSYDGVQDMAVYAYCANDPINKVDVLGLNEVHLERGASRHFATVYIILEKEGKGLSNIGQFFDSEITRMRIGSVAVNAIGDAITDVTLRPEFGGGKVNVSKLRSAVKNSYYNNSLFGAGDYIRYNILKPIGAGQFDPINEPAELAAAAYDTVNDAVYGTINFFATPFTGTKNPLIVNSAAQMRANVFPGWSAQVNSLSPVYGNGQSMVEVTKTGPVEKLVWVR